MRHKALFIRHNRLSGTYSDYSALTFSELRALGLDNGVFTINKDIPILSYTIDRHQKCLTSSQQRTIETASLLGCIQAESRSYLDEIHFDLAELMTEEEYVSGGGLPSVRIALWKSFFQRKTGVESPESVMARIELLLNEINQSSKEHIVVISHGFFLQMVRCLFVQKIDFTTISYEEFITLRAEPIVYLEGFEVIV